MPPEILSVTPQRLRCYICGAFIESLRGWKYRLRRGSHSPVCPSCLSKAEVDIAEMTDHPNLAGGVMLGALAAVAGAFAWFGVSALTHSSYEIVAVGIGCLVGRAVMLGSGNYPQPSFQIRKS